MVVQTAAKTIVASTDMGQCVGKPPKGPWSTDVVNALALQCKIDRLEEDIRMLKVSQLEAAEIIAHLKELVQRQL